jgi:Cu/Ag efflux pump CusA
MTTMTVLGLAAVLALVVDDVIGDVAAIHARARENREAGRSAVLAVVTAAVRGRRSPLVYATVLAGVALVPLLFLQGPAGAFVRPALVAFVLAALASFLVALVVTPVLAVLLYREPGREAPFRRWVHRGYRGIAGGIGRRVPALAALAVLLVLMVVAVPQLFRGSILPDLEDPNVLVRLEAAAGTSLAEMDRVTGLAAAELRDLPGVAAVSTHVGRAVGSDAVVDVDESEIWLTVDGDADYDATLADVRATVRGYPGLRSEVSSYADDRLAAVSASTGDDLVVRVSGEDYATLLETAEEVAVAMRTVEGVIEPRVEQLVSQPTMSVQVDLAAAQRFGLRPGDVRREVSALVSGMTVGSLYEQQAIFDVVVWGGPHVRGSVEAVRSLTVHTPDGQPVRLGDVAAVSVAATPTVISHDGVVRSIDVLAEVRGRSAADVAADATERLRQLTFAEEYRAEVLGDAVERAEERRTVLLAVIAAAVLAFLLLQAATNSWRGAVALFVATPLAGAGALLAGGSVGGAWSAGVLAALVAVVALAVRQSLVLVRQAQVLHGAEDRPAQADALRAAAVEQAPAVLVAVLATAAAVLPVAVLGSGPGLETLHRFAVALLGGLVTSTAVVLFLTPALFAAAGGLRPAPVVGPDTPDGEPPDTADPDHQPRHARPEGVPEARKATDVMTTHRWRRILPLLAVGLAAAGCTSAQSAETDSGSPPAVVEPAADGGPATLRLIDEAVARLGITTAPVTAVGTGWTIPYSALIYDAEGSTWTFVELEPGVYQRAAVTVTGIEGDTVSLSTGPPAGTPVVTVGAAELVGVEAGISGGE